MPKYTNEQLMENYKKLPKDVQDAITSVDTADILRQIGDGKKLMIDKVGELADETGLVLLGFTHPSQFVSHLSERLGIEKPLAKEIAEEVNARIFFPIRENLKKIHGLREEEIKEKEEKKEEKVPFPTSLPPITPPMPMPKQANEEEIPTVAALSPLPSALMPETVVLETTMPTKATTPAETLVQPITSIFEAKTKEGVFRLPTEVSEKSAEPPSDKALEDKKIDPYREPTK